MIGSTFSLPGQAYYKNPKKEKKQKNLKLKVEYFLLKINF